jgi:bifunctional non-homologous end joining protein LigD
VLYAVFDLLYLDGADWRARPLIERKDRLRELLAKKPPPLVFYSEHQETEGKDAWEHACEHGLEGVIGKRRDAVYVEERSRSWIKLKCRRGQELVIGGYTEPAGSRSGFGALLVGVREKDGLRYAGKVGSGFDERTLASLRKRLARLEQKKSPFDSGAAVPKGAHWVKPQLVADIKFHGLDRGRFGPPGRVHGPARRQACGKGDEGNARAGKYDCGRCHQPPGQDPLSGDSRDQAGPCPILRKRR